MSYWSHKVGVFGLLCGLATLPAIAEAQAACTPPGSFSPTSISVGPVGHGTSATYNTGLLMDPCHTLSVQVGILPNTYTVSWVSATVELLNSNNDVLFSHSETQMTSGWSATLPINTAPFVPPYRGTAGAGGRPSKIRLFITSPIWQTFSVGVNTTVAVRTDYNLGGDSLGTAPTLVPSQTYNGSLQSYEAYGQNFKTNLSVGQQLSVSGSRTSHSSQSVVFTIKVYNSAGTLVGQLYNQAASGTVSYSSSTFTAPSSGDYYVRFVCSGYMHDFSAVFAVV
jgi:hypothetical protein